MAEIIEEKMKQVKPFSERLSKFAKGTIFAHAWSTYDDFWGTGLDKNGTDHTQEGKWPGKNHLRLIIQKDAGVRKCHQRSWSCPKNVSKSQDKQDDITTMPENAQETNVTLTISLVARNRRENEVKILAVTHIIGDNDEHRTSILGQGLTRTSIESRSSV